MELKERLKELRQGQEISQEELAERVEVSRQTISKWENGAVQPSAENLLRLSEVYGIPVDALLKDDWQAPPEQTPAPSEVTRKPDIRPFWVPILAALVLTAAVFLGTWIAWSLGQRATPMDQLPNEEVIIPPPGQIPILPLD